MIRFSLLVVMTIVFASSLFAEVPYVIKASDFPKGGGLKIAATDVIVLDTEGFMPVVAHGSAFGPPDTVALHYVGDEVRGYYSLPYNSNEKVVTISAESLTPRKSPPFPGFEADAAVFLMVGREFPEGALDMGVFADQWTLNIDVE